jgi:hypothetical protein
MGKLKNITKAVTKFYKNSIPSSIAVITVATPIFALGEIGSWALYENAELISEQIANATSIPHEQSINAKFLGAGICFAGVGAAIEYTRKKSREYFKIPKKSKERIQKLHDCLHLAAFNLSITPIIYAISGGRSFQELAFPAALATTIGLFSGGLNGVAMDSYKDLCGLEECERQLYPNLIKRQGPKIKKGLAALVTAASIVLTTQIYNILPDKANYNPNLTTNQTQTSSQTSETITQIPLQNNYSQQTTLENRVK